MKRNSLILTVAVLACAAQSVKADDSYVQLKYDNCNPTQTGYVVADGIVNVLAYVGQVNLGVNTSSGFSGAEAQALVNQSVNGAIGAFCIDIHQETSGSYSQYGVTTALENAPKYGDNSTGMGTQRANDIRKLFAAHWAANMTADQAAAFQADIWEIINENSGTYDLGTGNLRVTEASGSGWTALGNAWLAELPTLTAMRMDVVALTSSDFQDFGVTVAGFAPSNSVPELDPGLLISSLTLLVGCTFIMTTTRRRNVVRVKA